MGWPTASTSMRRYLTALLTDGVCVGSPWVDELRWLSAVHPGDTLAGRLAVERVVASESQPDATGSAPDP